MTDEELIERLLYGVCQDQYDDVEIYETEQLMKKAAERICALHEQLATAPTLAETKRQELINRATAHETACKYAADFFDLKDTRGVTYISEPWLAPGKVLDLMIQDGLSNLHRSPTRRGKETVWPVYYAKFITEVLKLNGVNADVSQWNEEFEMQQIVNTFKNVIKYV